MPFYDQRSSDRRLEWGVMAPACLAQADVIIIVDVLSFSTCVDVATERGAQILKDTSAATFAEMHRAELAEGRGAAAYRLSPASYFKAKPDVRCVLPSPYGAAISLSAGAHAPTVFTACLRNADAVAEAAALVGHTFNVCPAAGERWPDGSLRPALEDWLGAGALLRRLPGTKSPEALAAIAAFETAEASLEAIMLSCSAGQELVERGYASDVRIAADYGVSNAAPILSDGVYINMNRSAADERLHLSSS